MERDEATQKFVADLEAYKKERQRKFDEVQIQKQAEADKSWDWFGIAPKKVKYIDPSEYEVEMPKTLAAWRGYLDELAAYNEKMETMDPSEKAYRESIGSLTKEPEKLAFDIPENLTWEELNKDLWDEYQNRLQAAPATKPTVQPTPAVSVAPTVQPAVTSTPSPTVSMIPEVQQRPGFGDFQALQNKPSKGSRNLLYNVIDWAKGVNEAGAKAVRSTNRLLGLPEQKMQWLPSKEGVQALPGEIKDRVLDKPGAPTWGDVLKNTIKSGLSQSFIGTIKTADMVLPFDVYSLMSGGKESYKTYLDTFEKRQKEAEESMQGAGLAKDIVYTGGSAAIPTLIDVGLGKAATSGTAVSRFGPRTIGLAVDTVAKALPFFQRSFGSYSRESELDGANRAQQAIYGLIGATVETVTELSIVENFYSGVVNKLPINLIMKTGAKRILTTAGGQAVVQGLYNAGLEYI
jgi:hypothetical protein